MENIKIGNVVVLKTYNENNEAQNKPPYMIIDRILEDDRIECIWYDNGEMRKIDLSSQAVMLWKKYN